MSYQGTHDSETAADRQAKERDPSIGRIVSVTGSKAIVMLDNEKLMLTTNSSERPEMGTLLGINTKTTVVLGLVSALSVPVPAQREGDAEIWIAELSLVGELPKDDQGLPGKFTRGVSIYPALGDRVRLATKSELAKSFSPQGENAVRVGAIRQDATIPAMIKTDDLLGKHFAILGTTGTGKSCTTALILRSILDKQSQPLTLFSSTRTTSMLPSFRECLAEVISPRQSAVAILAVEFRRDSSKS